MAFGSLILYSIFSNLRVNFILRQSLMLMRIEGSGSSADSRVATSNHSPNVSKIIHKCFLFQPFCCLGSLQFFLISSSYFNYFATMILHFHSFILFLRQPFLYIYIFLLISTGSAIASREDRIFRLTV